MTTTAERPAPTPPPEAVQTPQPINEASSQEPAKKLGFRDIARELKRGIVDPKLAGGDISEATANSLQPSETLSEHTKNVAKKAGAAAVKAATPVVTTLNKGSEKLTNALDRGLNHVANSVSTEPKKPTEDFYTQSQAFTKPVKGTSARLGLRKPPHTEKPAEQNQEEATLELPEPVVETPIAQKEEASAPEDYSAKYNSMKLDELNAIDPGSENELSDEERAALHQAIYDKTVEKKKGEFRAADEAAAAEQAQIEQPTRKGILSRIRHAWHSLRAEQDNQKVPFNPNTVRPEPQSVKERKARSNDRLRRTVAATVMAATAVTGGAAPQAAAQESHASHPVSAAAHNTVTVHQSAPSHEEKVPHSSQRPAHFDVSKYTGESHNGVKQGTLWSVSAEHLQETGVAHPTNTQIANEVQRIAHLNNIEDPNNIQAGKQLKV